MSYQLKQPLVFDMPESDPYHEIHGIQRGLSIRYRGASLIGEGVGIGGVVGVTSKKAIFPLRADLVDQKGRELLKIFHLNGISLKFIGPFLVEKPYKALKAVLSQPYLSSRYYRPAYILMMAARTSLGVRSRYVEIGSLGTVSVRYRLDGDTVLVDASADIPKGLKLFYANELSGRLFTHLRVGSRPSKFTPWMEVSDEVTLSAPALNLSMTFYPLKDCRMFVGREVLGRRLDWAGVSYQSSKPNISYKVGFRWRT
ncbi:hypothetical protein HRbin01_00356 [archaeon HR01]|nr:hypothetical protein HRbin01_00356 [archaeon HR01]